MMDQKKYFKKLQIILSKEELEGFEKDNDSLIDFGCEFMEQEDYKMAFKIFNIGYKLIGNDPDILNGIGVSLCELGRLKVSKSILERTLELYPDDAITLANLAGVYWEEGDFCNSIYYYHQSLKNDPNIQEAHFNLINIYYEQGHLFMAYISSLKLLALFPDNIQAKEIRDDILLDLGIAII